MNTAFFLITILFVIVSVAMILIILVQRPQGGGLAGAFGGAGGGGSETVFGGRVGDALTWATVVGFVIYLGSAIALNKIESNITFAAEQIEETPQMTRMEGPPPIDLDGTPTITPTPTPSGPPPGLEGMTVEPPVITPESPPADDAQDADAPTDPPADAGSPE
jgi:preprotein translocase subunit SecG